MKPTRIATCTKIDEKQQESLQPYDLRRVQNFMSCFSMIYSVFQLRHMLRLDDFFHQHGDIAKNGIIYINQSQDYPPIELSCF
jgi:hypothetical protein